MAEPWEYLPDPWRREIATESETLKESLQEIRFRVGRPVYLYGGFGTKALALSPTSAETLNALLLRLADHSLYARLDEIRQGYLTLPGGHRIGIAGRAVLENHRIDTVRDITGLSIRRARAVEGMSSSVLES
ncbi:MAG: stage III sporulation protein AA, partial [Firmicutes bacterium]|nr:stage III sporulation protein AA [Bacillota bacterium]